MRDWCPKCNAMVLVNSTIDHEKGTRTVFCYQCVAIIDVVPLAPAQAEESKPVNAPVSEVVNAFIWRQQDAVRNSIQMLGQSKFSHKQLHEKTCPQIQEMLFAEHGINWNDCPTPQKRGACIVRELYEVDPPPEARNLEPGQKVIRSRWVVDEKIPTFTQDREYIAKHLASEEAKAAA